MHDFTMFSFTKINRAHGGYTNPCLYKHAHTHTRCHETQSFGWGVFMCGCLRTSSHINDTDDCYPRELRVSKIMRICCISVVYLERVRIVNLGSMFCRKSPTNDNNLRYSESRLYAHLHLDLPERALLRIKVFHKMVSIPRIQI